MAIQRYPKKVRAGAITVRIYRTRSKRAASGFIYQVAWHDGTRRKLRQFTDSKDAATEAEILAADLNAGRQPGGLNRDDIDTLTTCRKLAGDISPVAALEQWRAAMDICKGNLIEAADLWRKANSGTSERLTLADAISRFKASQGKAGINVKATYKNRFEVLLAAFPGAMLANITTPQLTAFLERIPHPVTRNTSRKNLVTLWNWARRQGYIPDSVRTVAENTIRATEDDETEIGICTPDTLRQLFEIIATEHPHYLPPLTLAAFCGLRRVEVHNQQWADIDLDAGHLNVSKAKVRTPASRLVELPAAALRWLAICKNREGAICKNLSLDRIRNIGRDAGLELPENCFRHSFISYKIGLGLSKGQVATIAGTSEKQITKHYNKPSKGDVSKAWFEVTPGSTITTKAKGKTA
jgi:integrase